MQQPTCPRCGGAGWIVSEVNEISGATRCDCVAARRIESLEEKAQIPALYANASIDNFKLPRDNPTDSRSLAEVLMLVRAFQRTYPDPKVPGLLFVGQPGTGKTHLAVAALRYLMNKGFQGLFWDYQTLLNKIHSGYSKESGISEKEAYRQALDAEVLLLDDLGVAGINEWVESTITSIITDRCNNRKTLIATTNLGDNPRAVGANADGKIEYVKTLTDRIGDRARSRLFEMCRIIQMPAVEDYRRSKFANP